MLFSGKDGHSVEDKTAAIPSERITILLLAGKCLSLNYAAISCVQPCFCKSDAIETEQVFWEDLYG